MANPHDEIREMGLRARAASLSRVEAAKRVIAARLARTNMRLCQVDNLIESSDFGPIGDVDIDFLIREVLAAADACEAERNPFPTPRYHMLDIWIALGGDSRAFDVWIDEPKRTPADAWSQLCGAIRGDVAGLLADTNPPVGDELLALAAERNPNTTDACGDVLGPYVCDLARGHYGEHVHRTGYASWPRRRAVSSEDVHREAAE